MAEYGKTPEPQRMAQVPPPPPPPPPSAFATGDQSERALAEAWARSTGLVTIPNKPHKFNGWICFLLAWFWLIPAIVYYLWCEVSLNAYNNSVSDALRLWRSNGSPDPYARVGTTLVPPTTQVQPNPASLSERLQELAVLKEKELLSDEEFAAAKRKLLDI